MIYLFDKQMQLIEILKSPMTAVMNRRLIGVDRILVEDKADLKPLIDSSSYAGVFHETRFYIFRITQTSLVNSRASFEGVNYAYDELANISIIEDKRPENVTASVAIQTALEGTEWTLGAVENTSLQSTNFYYISPLQAIQKVIETWQIEPDFYFLFDGKQIIGRKIDVFQRRGSLTGERYVYGSDLLEIVHEEDRSQIVTAIIGRGRGEEIKDAEGNPTGGYGRRIDFADVVWSKAAGDPLDKPAGQLYLEVPEMTALYGYPKPDGSLAPRIDVFIDDQQTDPAEVLRNTYRVLIDKARTLLTFGSTVAKAGPYSLGDTNYIIRQDLGIYYEARIFEDEVNLLNPNLTKFKFGDYIPSGQAKRAREIKAQFEGLNEKINGVDKAVKGEIIKVSTDWYDALMAAKAEMFFSGSSYNYSLEAGNVYGLPAGFYSFDAPIDGDPGPTNFLTIHAGKLGRGTILPGGTWDFNLIGDASGLTADAITAGKIKAQFIEIGSSSTFLEGYDPSTKAEAGDVYIKSDIDTKFEVLDGEINSKVSSAVTEAVTVAPIYTWIKYADDINGTGISDSPTGKTYLGLAGGKTTQAESNVPTDYVWSKIEGPAGIDGTPGAKGQGLVSASTQYYRSTSNSTQTGGSWLDAAPAFLINTYMWTRLKSVWENPTDTTYSVPILDQAWGKLIDLDSRTTSAEQKITPDKIKQTVESEVSLNGSTVLATKSDITQTDAAWTATFSRIGGKNLILNSNATISTSSYQIANFFMTEDWVVGDWYTFSLKGTKKATQTFDLYQNAGNTHRGTLVSKGNDIWSLTFQAITATTGNEAKATLYQISNGNVGPVVIGWVQLEKGKVQTDWAEAPEEMYTGITSVDATGITIGRTGESVETKIANDGLRIKDGTTEVASFTDAGAVISDLQADTISGNILNLLPTATITLYVGNNQPFPSVAQALLSYGSKKVLNGTTLNIRVYGVLKEDVKIENYSGQGLLSLILVGGAKINGSISISGCSCGVIIRGETSANGTILGDGSLNVVFISGSPITEVYLLNIGNNGTTTAVRCERGSKTIIHDCDIFNSTMGIRADTGAIISAYANRGSVTRGLYASYGGIIFAKGTKPYGSSTDYKAEAGFIFEDGTSTLNSAYSPPSTTPTAFTGTFSHSDIFTYSFEYSGRSSYYGKSGAQNRWDSSTGQFDARIVFNSEVYAYIADRDAGNTPTVQIRLRRKNSTHGTSNSVSPDPDWSGAPSFGGATRGNWTPWATIPYTLIGGSGYTFSFGTGTTGSNYAIWDMAEIKVTKVKTV